jgi:NADH-quinone oxidoreductase subunit M
MLGAFTSRFLGMRIGTLAALGIILGAVYMLHLAARVIWGPLKTPFDDDGAHGHGHGDVPGDLNKREIAILVPLAIAVVLLGVAPGLVTKSMTGPVNELLQTVSPQNSGTMAMLDR